MAFNASVDHTIMINVSKDSPEIEAYGATTTILPGILLAWNTSGAFIKHDLADGACQKIFAVENDRDSIHVPYAIGARIISYNMRAGDVIWAWLADTETVAVGSFVTSAGAGLLGAVGTAVAGSIVGVSKEALTASGNTLFKIEVM